MTNKKKQKKFNKLTCNICMQENTVKRIYKHRCRIYVCLECIFINILIYRRTACPYCKFKYRNKEFAHMIEIDPDLFRKVDLTSMKRVFHNCDSPSELIEACADRFLTALQYRSSATLMINFVAHLNDMLLYRVYPWILYMSNKFNIILINEIYLSEVMKLVERGNYIDEDEILNIKYVSILSKTKSCMYLYPLAKIVKVMKSGDGWVYTNLCIEKDPLEYEEIKILINNTHSVRKFITDTPEDETLFLTTILTDALYRIIH